MKRVLCGLALVATAFVAMPAHASEIPATVNPVVDDHHVGVYVTYGDDEPLGGASVNRDTGRVCVGIGYQIPQCVGGPIS